MFFTLQKVEQVEVNLDFDLLYEAVKNDLSASPDEYDSIAEYNAEIAEFFECNVTVFLHNVFGLNFDEDEDGPYYDTEENEYVLNEICDAFTDYVNEHKNKV
jgi:hypothetical protein